MKYFRPVILLLGIISEAIIIYRSYITSTGSTKESLMLLMSVVLLCMFAFAFYNDIKNLKKK